VHLLADNSLLGSDLRKLSVWASVIRSSCNLRAIAVSLAAPVPIGLVLADLADHAGPREDARVRELLEAL